MKNYKNHLYKQLVRLGDMMGDGYHLEPDGRWIEKEYRNILKLLGISTEKPWSSKKRDTKSINEFMEKRLQEVRCECGRKLYQSRKGSFIATCSICDKRYKLGVMTKKC